MSRQPELFPTENPDKTSGLEGFELREGFLAPERTSALMAGLLETVPWEVEEITIFQKVMPCPRLTAWYGDEGAGYVYSGIPHEPLPWTAELASLRDEVCAATGARFNSVLLNRYRGGEDSVSWHRDDEPELGRDPVIASLSLGATRRFKLRDLATKETQDLDLGDGSLLIMSGPSQREWEHCAPKTKRPVGERVNLTFRWVDPAS